MNTWRKFARFAAIAAVCVPWLAAESRVWDDWIDIDELMDLKVTVTRREESVDQVPARVRVLAGSDLQGEGLRSLLDIGRAIPSLEFSRVFDIPFAFSRGVGSDILSIGVDTSTAVHLDGVYLGLPDMMIPFLWDIDRVEILSGPQGSLYGRNASAGVVNILTRKPDTARSLNSVAGFFGNRGQRGVEATSNQVLAPSQAIRLSLFGRWDDGQVRNLSPGIDRRVDDHDVLAARLQWLMGDAHKSYLLFAADRYEDRNRGNVGRPLDTFGAAYDRAAPAPFGDTRLMQPLHADVLSEGVRSEWRKVLADWTWSGNFSWRHGVNNYLTDTDGTEVAITDTDSSRSLRQASADVLGATGSPSTAGRWTVGLNAIRADGVYELGLVRTPLGVTLLYHSPLQTRALSGFVEWDRAWVNGWSVTLGGRFSNETKQQDMSRVTVPGLAGLASPRSKGTSPIWLYNCETWNRFTPRFVTAKAWDARNNSYASITNGFKSGGINSLAATKPVEPEDVWNYEIGHKYHNAATGLSATVALFCSEYRNLQVNTYANSGAVVSNAADATVKGVELSFAKQLTSTLSLSADGTALDAKYRHFLFGLGSVPFVADGRRMPHAPQWRSNVSLRNVWAFASGKLVARLAWIARSRTYFNAAEDDVMSERALDLFDTSLCWQGNAGWWMRLTVTNAGDVRYLDNAVRFTSTSSSSHPEGNALGFAAPRRSIELSAGLDF